MMHGCLENWNFSTRYLARSVRSLAAPRVGNKRTDAKASVTPELGNLSRMFFGNLLKSPTLVFTIYVPEGLLLLPKAELQTDYLSTMVDQ